MKNSTTLLFTLCIFALSLSASAQNDTIKVRSGDMEINVAEENVSLEQDSITAQGDTTRIKVGEYRILISQEGDFKAKRDDDDDLSHGTWSGIDIGVNGLFDSDYSLDLSGEAPFLEIDYARSRKISFNVYQHHFRVIGSAIGFTTGLGVEWYNFKLKNDSLLSFQGDSIVGFDPMDDRGVLKNKLRVAYLTVPLMLDINTSPDPSRSFHLSAGVIGKLRIGNAYKQRYRLDGETYKETVKGDLQTAPFQVDATVRVGYGWFTLWGTAGMLPLFENDANPDLYTWSAGIALRIGD